MVARMMLLWVTVALLSPVANGQTGQPDPTTQEILATVRKIDSDNNEIKARLSKLERDIKDVTDLQVEDRTQLQQIAQQDKNGKSYLRLDATHEPTRIELQRAMDLAARETADVTIYNDMSSDQPVSINGQTYDVLARDKRVVQVPVGEFRVKVRGQTQSEVRYAGYPGYRAAVRIVAQTPVYPVVYDYGWAPIPYVYY